MSAENKMTLTKSSMAKLVIMKEEQFGDINNAVELLFRLYTLSKDHAFDMDLTDGKSFHIIRIN
jgi:hypothetical protein